MRVAGDMPNSGFVLTTDGEIVKLVSHDTGHLPSCSLETRSGGRVRCELVGGLYELAPVAKRESR